MSKILFITKPFVVEPLGIMYLSGALKSKGHDTFWITTGPDVEGNAKKISPDFVVYSIMTGDQGMFDSINKNLKSKLNFFSIAGGPHTTFFPESISAFSFDAVCVGEGELALVELVDCFGKGIQKYDIPNFWFKVGNEVHKNPVRPLVDDLDSITFPDRELVYSVDDAQRNNPIKHFIAGRGCPYNCTYCFNHSYNRLYSGKGKIIRLRSVGNLIAEIKEAISAYPTKFVYFQDDTFILDKVWLKDFSERYPIEIGMPFHCHVRANLVDEETIRLLKEAGCFSVHIAVESGNERLRNEILKRAMPSEQIYAACALLHRFGIRFMLQNIIGLPTGSLEEDFETLEMNIKCKPTYAWVSIFQPYPGTDLAKLCIEKNLVSDGDLNNIQSNFFDRSVLKIGNRKEVEYLQKLFAITVEHPDIYHSGLLKSLLELPDSEEVRAVLSKVYKSFRQNSDERLYGFKL